MKQLFYYTRLVLFALLQLSCEKKAEKEESLEASPEQTNVVALTDAQFKNAAIETGLIEKKNIGNLLTVSGIVDVPPQNLISVSAPLGGFVKKTSMLPGSRVKKGQVIVVMENPEFIQLQKGYLDSKNKLDLTKLEYERQSELNKENVNSSKVFQQAIADYKNTKNEVKAYEERLALIGIRADKLNENNISRAVPIYASINGYVSMVNVNPGKYVNPTDVMFEIVNVEDMHLQLTVFENDAASIHKDQKITFTLPDDDGKERTATVFLIGRSIREDRSINVHAHVDKQPDPKLLPGMFVKAQIETKSSNVYAVPESAIVKFEDKQYFFVAKGKSGNEYNFEMIEIDTGISENDYIHITVPKNIDINSTSIVTKGSFTLLSKLKNTEEEE